MSNGNWTNVSRRNPCPICGHADWCTVSNDGMMCVCRRVESDRQAKSGMGWIHVLIERPKEERVHIRPKRPAVRLFDADAVMRGFRDEYLFRKTSDAELSWDLGLPVEAVGRMEAGRSGFNRAWAFPMLDGEGRTAGIRLREYGGSRKWSVAGSADGLFYAKDVEPAETIYNGLRGREMVVVEGASDCIAGYAIGLPCVGRSSCGTGRDHLRRLCDRLRVSRLTIVADNDCHKERHGGAAYRPGVDGANRLALDMGRTYRIVVPPRKDLRDLVKDGFSSDDFWRLANFQKWRIG